MAITDEQAAEAAAMFKALGDRTRFRIFRYLCSCSGPVTVEANGDVRTVGGATAGEVCCHITGEERVTGVISFHLKELRQAGLIRMERRGKYMLCSLDPGALGALAAFLAAGESAESACGGGDAALHGGACGSGGS